MTQIVNKHYLDSKIGICMLLSSYAPEGFGGSHQCRSLIQALNGRFLVHVLTTSLSSGRYKKYSTVDGVEVFRVRIWRSLILNLLCSVPQIIWTFLRLSSRIQIVHCHGVTSKNYLIVLLAKLLGKKVIQKFTSFGFDDPLTLEKQSLWKLKRTLWTRCDCFLGVSPAFSKSFAWSSLRKNRYLEIPNGVDLQRFHPVASEQTKRDLRKKLGLPLESKVILFVGFFSREKGIEDLFFAWRDLIQAENVNSVLVLVGAKNVDYSEISKEIVDRIQRLIEKEGLNSRVFFQEKTERIEEYYQTADLFVLPSYREGLPNALLEAMACGLPVITSRLAGVTDSVVEEGKSGLFFEVGDREMLKAKVRKLLKDSSLAETLGKNARKKVENDYDVKKIAELHAKLYQELICAA